MSRVTASIEIDAPPERVWDMVMDPGRLGDWVTIHRRLVRADRGAPRVGFEMEQAIHLRGVTVDVHWELVECEAARRAVWEGRGPARSRAHTEYLLTRDGERTRFDYQNEFRAPLGPVGALVSRALVGGIPVREANRTLQALKQKIEQGP
jgi:carbon monoxide dehydrogenase subunit G